MKAGGGDQIDQILDQIWEPRAIRLLSEADLRYWCLISYHFSLELDLTTKMAHILFRKPSIVSTKEAFHVTAKTGISRWTFNWSPWYRTFSNIVGKSKPFRVKGRNAVGGSIWPLDVGIMISNNPWT